MSKADGRGSRAVHGVLLHICLPISKKAGPHCRDKPHVKTAGPHHRGDHGWRLVRPPPPTRIFCGKQHEPMAEGRRPVAVSCVVAFVATHSPSPAAVKESSRWSLQEEQPRRREARPRRVHRSPRRVRIDEDWDRRGWEMWKLPYPYRAPRRIVRARSLPRNRRRAVTAGTNINVAVATAVY